MVEAEAAPPHARSRLPGTLLLLLLLPAGALAQTPRWQVDLNGSRIEYDTLGALNAPSLASTLEWENTRLLGRVGASLTGFEGAGHTLQGRADGVGWFSPLGDRRPYRLEVAGSLQGSSHSSGFDTYQGQVETRFHWLRPGYGAWVGLGAGTSKNTLDPEAVGNAVPELGGWIRVGPTRLVARLADTRLEGERFPEATLSAVYSRGRVDATAWAGARSSPFEGEDDDRWIGASVAVWIQDRLAVLLSGGQYAPDIFQGIPGGEFISVGVRFAPRRVRPLAPAEPLPLVFTAEVARAGRLGFSLDGAQSVAIAGDWNGWQPTPMTRGDDGRWLVPGEIPAGVHRFNLLVDGERWVVPDEVASVEDGFGGQVGLLVISEN